MDEQLRRTVIAWELVKNPGEQCVLWDLDNRVGGDQLWGIDLARVAEIQAAVTGLRPPADREPTNETEDCRAAALAEPPPKRRSNSVQHRDR